MIRPLLTIILAIVASHWCSAIDGFIPKTADPMLEEWRYAFFPELDDKGIRSIASNLSATKYWFALDSGVMGYDGYDWSSYTHMDGLTGLPAQLVFVDQQEQVIAATSDGLFQLAKNKWIPIFQNPGSIPFDFKFIKQLQSGTLLCGSAQGAFFVRKDRITLLTTDQLARTLGRQLNGIDLVTIPYNLLYYGNFDNFSDALEVSKGQLWIAATYLLEDEKGDIMVLSEKEILEGKLESYNLLSRYYDIELGYEQGFFRDSKNRIWIVNKSNKLPALKFENNRWRKVSYGAQFGDDEYTEDILESGDGKIWVSGIGNLYCLDTDNRWSKYSSETLKIPQAHIKLYTCTKSDIWVYGYQSSVHRVDLSTGKWLTYPELNYQAEQSDGTRWFLDFAGNAIYNHGNHWYKVGENHQLISDPVSLFVDSRDICWASGSHNGNASAGYFKNGHWVNFSFDSLSWSLDYRAIYESNDGSIWLGGCTDVYLDKGQTGGLIQIVNPYGESPEIKYHRSRTNGLNQLNVYGIAGNGTSPDTLWIGGSKLNYFDGNSWHLSEIPDLNDFVNEVISTPDNRLFVGSRKHGLFIKYVNKWMNHSVSNGLVSNNIIGIAANPTNNEIWLATDKDYSFFNGEVWSNHVFPGQLTLSYEGGSIRLGSKNEVWINRSPREWKRRVYTGREPNETIRKKFTTHRFVRDTVAPQTIIEVYSSTVDKSGNTSIFWSGRHFFNKTSAEKLFYSYRLNGGEWSNFGTSMNHTFTGLESGEYLFEVRAMDTEGNIDNTPAAAAFFVAPPVWKQPWFIALIGSFLLVLGYFQYLIIKKREILAKLNKSLQSANEELEARNKEVQTQRDSLEDAVQKIDQLSQAKVKFFTNITHEFRTPLSLILGPIEKLSAEVNPGTTVHNFYTVIKKNALRLQKLINQLLEVRRIESGNLELVLTEGELVGFIREIKNLFAGQANDRNIRFNFTADFERLTICFDHDKIEKIVFNLLSNAFKHTPENGKIHVKLLRSEASSSDPEKSYVQLVVQDNGTGMEPHVMEHLFERFTVGHNEVEDQTGESSGIGLSYIKDLIEFHKGSITVNSQTGKGTCFIVNIPEYLTADSSDLGQMAPGSIEPKIKLGASILSTESLRLANERTNVGADSPTILIVEDNPDMRYFIRNILSAKYNILSACDGKEGLELLDKEYVDLIVSDIMMPEIDGLAFCQQAKSDPAISHIPVILLTALNVDDKRIDGYESGADSYIVKPFKPELLLARVENLIESRELLKTKYAEDLRFKPKNVKVTSVDEEFLDKLSLLMEEHVSDAQFDVARMCEMVNMSHMHFIRKVKQLTGKKPKELLKTFRLTRAKQLLEQNKISVSEVSYMVGYDLPNSFTRAFKNEFGISPTQFAQTNA